MARAPRASVSKTSGQGVSRLGYQKAYRLRNNADTPEVKTSFKAEAAKPSRSYGKAEYKGDPKINVDYADTLRGLDQLPDVPKSPPKSGIKNASNKGKKLK